MYFEHLCLAFLIIVLVVLYFRWPEKIPHTLGDSFSQQQRIRGLQHQLHCERDHSVALRDMLTKKEADMQSLSTVKDAAIKDCHKENYMLNQNLHSVANQKEKLEKESRVLENQIKQFEATVKNGGEQIAAKDKEITRLCALVDQLREAVPIKVGDTVQLLSGGPQMTVAVIKGEKVRCTWFKGSKHREIDTALPELRKIVEKERSQAASQSIFGGNDLGYWPNGVAMGSGLLGLAAQPSLLSSSFFGGRR